MPERLRPTDADPSDARNERARQLVAAGFQALVEELRQGKSEHLLRYLDFCARFHRYSSYNQMSIYLQRPDATFVAGYKRWQELGYQVRHGEKGIAIFAPKVYKQQDAAGNEAERLAGFRVAYVFDASQLANTDDKPLPVFWRRLPDDQEAAYNQVKAAVAACGITVQEQRLQGRAQGESKGGQIILAEGRDSRSRTLTLIHEWAHEVLHRTWMADEAWQALPVSVRECQAEAVSYVVSRYLGIENPFARDYLLSYGNTPEALVANLDPVQKTSHWMIEQLAQVT